MSPVRFKAREFPLAKLEEAPATTTLTAIKTTSRTSYNSAWNDLNTTFINLATIVTGIDDMLNKQGQFLSDSSNQFFNGTTITLRNQALSSDAAADNNYQSSLNLYKPRRGKVPIPP